VKLAPFNLTTNYELTLTYCLSTVDSQRGRGRDRLGVFYLVVATSSTETVLHCFCLLIQEIARSPKTVYDDFGVWDRESDRVFWRKTVPTAAQAVKAIILCQNLSNGFQPIELLRYDRVRRHI